LQASTEIKPVRRAILAKGTLGSAPAPKPKSRPSRKQRGRKRKVGRVMIMKEARWPVQIVGLQGDFKACT
jgi:hypothetical protein